MPLLTYYPHSVRSKLPGQIHDVPWDALAEYLESHATDVRKKGASGYWVAAACHGAGRSDAQCEPTDLVALDWDDPGPTSEELSRLLGNLWYVAHTTDSHTEAAPRWRVWVRLVREYTAEELRRISLPSWWVGAKLRAISQPAFVPTLGRDVWWIDAGYPRRMCWAPVLTETRPAPVTEAPPLRGPPRQDPSRAATNALVCRWFSRPEGTNRLAGALGATLAEWGWTDAEVEAWMHAWLSADPKLAKHQNDAVRGAQKRRAGDRIVGFPVLDEELGAGVWAPERPDHLDVSAMVLAAASPAVDGAGKGPFQFYDAAEIASAALPEPNWVCPALVMAPGAPVIVSGWGGSGKTTFVQHLATCVAQGGRLLGEHEVRHADVVHLDHEQGLSLSMRLYQRLGLRSDARLRLASFPRWSLADASAAAREAFVRVVPRDGLVIIDSFLASCAAFLESENDSTGRQPLDFLTELSEATGATFLIIHHSRKDRSDRGASIRGTSALNDACSLHISYEREDRAERPVLSLGKVRNIAPAGALVGEEIEVAIEQLGSDRFTLVGLDVGAQAREKEVALEDSIVSLLSTGPWAGSKNELVDYLGKRKSAVVAALGRLEQNGIIVARNGIIQLVPESSGTT